MKSLEIKPIRCATTLCHFGRTRNGYVGTHFILLSSTAESSATGSYVVLPQRVGQNEEPASRKEERAEKKPIFVPSSGCVMKTHVNMNSTNQLYVLYFMYFIHVGAFFLMENLFDLLFMLLIFVSARE